MMPYYYDNDNYCKAWNINDNLYWLIINNFIKLVNSDKYKIIAITFLVYQNWQFNDKIY